MTTDTRQLKIMMIQQPKRRSIRPKLVPAKRNPRWIFRADRPYRGVRIEIMGNQGPRGFKEYYYCLRRAGSNGSTAPSDFRNSSSRIAGRGVWRRKDVAFRMALAAIDAGYPK